MAGVSLPAIGAAALMLLAAEMELPFTARLEPAPPPPELARAHRDLLEARPLVVRAGPETVMEVWFRAEIPVSATEAQLREGLTYRAIPEGALVGAVRFPREFTDYRKQRLPAGTYTLRFALQPDTGDHTGTAPHPEFCLLTRAADDAAAAPLPPKQLVELSSKVNDGRHPAVLLLWPRPGTDASVRVLRKADGVFAATARRPVVAGKRKSHLGFAVTVAGWWKQ